MNRVTLINLAGRAVHVEDDGVAAIDAWLTDARTMLATDPDRDELLADFERAIADKCEARTTSDRDVVTAVQVREILTALGTVEPVEGLDPAVDASTVGSARPGVDGSRPGSPATPYADTPWRERRLYRLTGEDESMIAGVCAGLAAYLRMDVTVVRVLVVILTIVTSGGAAIAYIAMALLVPPADSPERRAAARGYGDTAQEMISRARAGAGPALNSLGSLISSSWTLVMRVLHGLFIASTWIVLVAWAVQVAWVAFDGGPLADAFDAGTSRWLIALFITCLAWPVAAILLGLIAATGRLAHPSRPRSRGREVAASAAWLISVTAALLGVFAIPAANSRQLSGLTDGHGRVTVAGRTYCITEPGSDLARSADCHPGDTVVDVY